MRSQTALVSVQQAGSGAEEEADEIIERVVKELAWEGAAIASQHLINRVRILFVTTFRIGNLCLGKRAGAGQT